MSFLLNLLINSLAIWKRHIARNSLHVISKNDLLSLIIVCKRICTRYNSLVKLKMSFWVHIYVASFSFHILQDCLIYRIVSVRVQLFSTSKFLYKPWPVSSRRSLTKFITSACLCLCIPHCFNRASNSLFLVKLLVLSRVWALLSGPPLLLTFKLTSEAVVLLMRGELPTYSSKSE